MQKDAEDVGGSASGVFVVATGELARRGIARVRVERLDETASIRDARHGRRSYRETPSRYRYRRYHRRRLRRRHYYASVLEPPRPAPRIVASPVGDWLLGMLP